MDSSLARQLFSFQFFGRYSSSPRLTLLALQPDLVRQAIDRVIAGRPRWFFFFAQWFGSWCEFLRVRSHRRQVSRTVSCHTIITRLEFVVMTGMELLLIIKPRFFFYSCISKEHLLWTEDLELSFLSTWTRRCEPWVKRETSQTFTSVILKDYRIDVRTKK